MNKIKLLTQLKRHNYDGKYEYVLKELIDIIIKQQKDINTLKDELELIKKGN